MNQLSYWLYAYQQCLPADHYIVRLVDAFGSRKTQPRRYEYRHLPTVGKYLQSMNSQGYHVYCRPEGYEFVLVDDILKDKLSLLVALKPAIVMETSPNNFQAFLHMPSVPAGRVVARSICQEACALLGGDPGSAEPDHVGRLPGFFNLKPKHKSKGGKYPEVILHHALEQFTSFPPQGRQAGGGVSRKHRDVKSGKNLVDRSREDFALACLLWRAGKQCGEIEYEISQREKGRDRPDYVKRTVANAYRCVKEEGTIS